MKRITAFALLLLSVTLSSAQFTSGKYNDKYFEAFFKSTTYVALTGDSLFDVEMQKCMQRFWKITPYKFLNEKEFKSMARKNTEGSFLGFLHKTVDYWGYSVYTADKLELQLFMGCENFPDICGWKGSSNLIAHFTWQKLLSMSGEKTVDMDKLISEYYRLPDVINSMHMAITRTRDDKVSLYQFKDYRGDFVEKVLNKDASAMKTKTLYILKDDVRSDIDLAKAKSIYPYKFKIVSTEELKQAILSDDKSVVYMANNDECGPSFYDIASHVIVGAMNYGYHVQFRTQDFKDIAAFVKKHSK